MAEEKKINGTENQQAQGEAPQQEETIKSKAKEFSFRIPNWLVTFGNVLEGILALFGALVGALVIKDSFRPKQQRQSFTPAQTEVKPETKYDYDVKITDF